MSFKVLLHFILGLMYLYKTILKPARGEVFQNNTGTLSFTSPEIQCDVLLYAEKEIRRDMGDKTHSDTDQELNDMENATVCFAQNTVSLILFTEYNIFQTFTRSTRIEARIYQYYAIVGTIEKYQFLLLLRLPRALLIS